MNRLAKWCGLMVVSVPCLGSCDSDDDTSGTGGTGASSETAAGGTGGGDGGSSTSGSDDPYAPCNDYCDRWIECTAEYASFDECYQACKDDIAGSSLGGLACFSAHRAMIRCIGDLTCEQLADWAEPGEPCEELWSTVQTSCST